MSILSTTVSGSHRPLTLQFLLSCGWSIKRMETDTDRVYYEHKIYKDETHYLEYTPSLIHEFLLDDPKSYSIRFTIDEDDRTLTFRVTTINDLLLIEKHWRSKGKTQKTLTKADLIHSGDWTVEEKPLYLRRSVQKALK